MKYTLFVSICLIFSVAGFAFGRLTAGNNTEKHRLAHDRSFFSSKIGPRVDNSVRTRIEGDFIGRDRLDLANFSSSDVFPGLKYYLKRFPLNGVLYGALER